MGRGAQQEARRQERALIVDDDTLWHMVFVAVVSFFDVRDGHIDDRKWTDEVFSAIDLSKVSTGVTNSMRSRYIQNFTHDHLSTHGC